MKTNRLRRWQRCYLGIPIGRWQRCYLGIPIGRRQRCYLGIPIGRAGRWKSRYKVNNECQWSMIIPIYVFCACNADDGNNNNIEFRGENGAGALWTIGGLGPVWPEKNCQMSIKLPKNDFTIKMLDFDTFTKIA